MKASMKRSIPGAAAGVLAAAACLPLAAPVGCATDRAQRKTDAQRLAADAPNATDVEVGGTFAAEMPMNAGTGYVWGAVGFDAEVVSLESRESRPDAPTARGARAAKAAQAGKTGKTAAVGGPMLERFTFRALKPGETEIRFELRRPWEKDVSPADVRTMRVKVMPSHAR